MSEAFDAEPELIRAHAGKILDLATRMDTADGAADETLDNNAFGIFGQFLAIGRVAQGALVKGVLSISAGTVHLGKDALDATASTYEGIEQVGAAAAGMAGAVQGAGVVVGAVRGIVRDLIAQVCGDIAEAFVKWGIAALLTAGIAVGGMIADGVRIALKWADKVREWMDKLGTALSNLLTRLDELGSGTHQIGTQIGSFFQNAQAPGNATFSDVSPQPTINSSRGRLRSDQGRL
ncbi:MULTISPECIES: hypothetical protein [Actinoalloteichus]|uniref:Uncharacterized protein n=1 Tax=Actinoalloteichus fjordicus TaxID=1612552 RepID=A0AAC9PPR8_9PSEU|nr:MULTISPECIES: hypothetical protein [Actinoalloteichus]APU12350.1 hypothetical protein UA74_01300 [Actinoalloteichus fjordicus]APU18302.1 hypothetical protein UA75_01300 [Actinoalloteichus sp. GBA129-24]